MLNGLDLFSGGGGLTEGLHRWVRPVAYCEIEPGAQRVLLSRMARRELPRAPIWDDVRTLRGAAIPPVDIIIGGFPCQDISLAGTGKGLDGERSGLVFEYLRLVGECRPRFVFMENVAALAVRGLDRVLLGLDAMGYDARWTIVSAAEVGAPHLRERIWILAHAHGHALRLKPECECWRSGTAEFTYDGPKEPMAAAAVEGLERWIEPQKAWAAIQHGGGCGGGEGPSGLPKPSICRGNDGMADRVNRLRVLGNGVVPLCAETAFERLLGIGG